MKTAKAKKAIPFGQKPDGHYMGRTCGYDVLGGRYYLPPVVREPMDRLHAEEEGIRRLLDLLADHCSSLLSNIATRKQEWFTRVCEELGIPETLRARVLYHFEGCIALKPEGATTPKPHA